MNDSGRKLISHGSIYFLGNIMMRAVSFIMLPIYTRYLSPQDFGTIELLTMTIDLVGILLGLRIGQAIFRYYHEYEGLQDKNEVVSTSLYMVGILNVIGLALLLFFSEPLTVLVFGDNSQVTLLMVFSVTLLFHSYIEVPMIYIRVRQKPWTYVFFSTVKLVIQLGLNIYLVVILKMGVAGIIYSAIISGGLIAVALLVYTVGQTGMRWSMRKARQLAGFSLPMVLTSIISFYITFGDRYFLRAYSTLEEIGIYALGYKFGFLLGFIVTGPFLNIWDSEKYNIYSQPDAKDVYRHVFLAFSALILIFVVGVSLLVEDVLKIMADPSFWRAAAVAPLVLIAYAFNSWYGFTNMGILISKKTAEMTYGTIIAAVVATIGYFTLIPLWGGTGAAVATILAFGSRCLWTTWRSRQLYDMNLDWGKVLLMVVAGLVVWGLSRFAPAPILYSVTYNLFLAFAYLLSLFLLPIFPLHWRTGLLQAMSRPGKLMEKLRPVKR